jgi:hypothetical protein
MEWISRARTIVCCLALLAVAVQSAAQDSAIGTFQAQEPAPEGTIEIPPPAVSPALKQR